MGIIPLLIMAAVVSIVLDRMLPDFERPSKRTKRG